MSTHLVKFGWLVFAITTGLSAWCAKPQTGQHNEYLSCIVEPVGLLRVHPKKKHTISSALKCRQMETYGVCPGLTRQLTQELD